MKPRALTIWFVVIGLNMVSSVVLAQEDLNVFTKPENTILHDYLITEANKLFDKRRETVKKSLQSREALLARQKQLRRRYRRILGYLPEKTPLNPIVTGTVQCEGYRIEKIAFESRPNHHVTANLYIPGDAKGRFPGILIPCGHSGNGKAADAYQSASIILAKNGFVVLIVDPICQGERLQILERGSKYGTSGTTAHTLLDVGAKLVGCSVTGYEAWDNIRAIDYLQTRPEVDPEKIGVTGNSGGGTQTTFLMALDERVDVAAPSCYIMTREKLFATIGPQDGCQNLYAEVALGIEHADYITMRAPKPTIILAAKQDFFDFEGVQQAYAEAKRVFTVLGKPDYVDMFSYDDTHGFSKPRRQAATQWMRRWFYEDPADIIEFEPNLLPEQSLWVTNTGQVREQWPNEITVADLNLARAKALTGQRQQFLQQEHTEILKRIARLIGYRKPTGKVIAVHTGTILRNDIRIEKGVLNRTGQLAIPILLCKPIKAKGKLPITLYVDGRGKSTDAQPGGPIETLVHQDKIVLSIDVRGVGETSDDPAKNRYAGGLHDEWRNAMLGLHIARPLIGRRAIDVVTALDFLTQYPGVDMDQIEVIGIDRCGPVVLHAAVLDNRITRVKTIDSIPSWTELVAQPMTRNSLSYVVPFVLEYYDLPDLNILISQRKKHGR
ncbi:MAG: acetylxylan esterase [Sedimentisphaerales bacterium]|nr:acetylxylan esterase [Sedimentisphaerales bacterium]